MWLAVNESSFPPHFEPLERTSGKFLEFVTEPVRSVLAGHEPATAVGDRGMQLEVILHHPQRETVVADELRPKVLVPLEFLAVSDVQRQGYCPCPRWCGRTKPFLRGECDAG